MTHVEGTVSNCDFQACGSHLSLWNERSWGRITSSMLLHMNCHAGCCQENARPRACFVFLSQFCFSNIKELPACSTPLLLYLFTYQHVGQFHQDTLLPFSAVSVHSCVTYCCPVPFLWCGCIAYHIFAGPYFYYYYLWLLMVAFLRVLLFFFWFVVLIFFPLGPTRCLAACLPATNSPFPWQPLAAWKWGRNAPVTLVMTYYWYHNALHVTLISHVVVVVTA